MHRAGSRYRRTMAMSRDPFILAFVSGVTPSKWAGVWRERMRDVPIELVPMSQAEAELAVVNGRAHVALLRVPFRVDGTDVIPLYTERSVVVAPKDHALEAADEVTLSDLTLENILTGEAAAAVELVAANVGVAIMPQSIARVHSRKDVITRFITDAPETQVGLAWRSDRTGPLIEEFIGIVRGRTANSSRGAVSAPLVEKPQPRTVATKSKSTDSRRAQKPRSKNGRKKS
jgi:DNA-binding transcriptional LysR family regulator